MENQDDIRSMSDDRYIVVRSNEALQSGSIIISSPSFSIGTLSGSGILNVEILGSGSVEFLGSAELTVKQFFSQTFPWNIGGEVDFGFTSSWNVGSGEFYWYRIESECGAITCEVNDVRYTDCPNMTVVTMVAARGLGEVCRTLRSPSYTSSAKMRIRSIARYSRPVLKDNIVDGECNILEEQEYCQVSDCLDYCIDQNILIRAGMEMSVAEQTLYDMSGSAEVSGSAFGPFEPSGSIYIGGMLEDIGFAFSSLINVGISGSADLPGFLESVFSLGPPYNSKAKMKISSSARLGFSPQSSVNLALLGSASASANKTSFFSPEGGIRVDGCGTPDYGDNLGIVDEVYKLAMDVVEIREDYLTFPETNTLTAGLESVPITCGCGPLAQLLYVTHNLTRSKAFGSFVERNSLDAPSRSPLRYRGTDRSWRLVEHYSGISMKGPGIEDWTLFMSLLCSTSTWQFSFRVQSQNRSQRRVVKSQFAVEIPSSTLCVNNNVSTVLEMDVTPFQTPSSGVQVLVVEGGRVTSPAPRGVAASIAGSFLDFKSFSDELGIFSDSYWQRAPFQIRINAAGGTIMPALDLGRIIPSEPTFPA